MMVERAKQSSDASTGQSIDQPRLHNNSELQPQAFATVQHQTVHLPTTFLSLQTHGA